MTASGPGPATGAADLEQVYRDLHAHPELSLQEHRTAALAGDQLAAAGFEVTTNIGGTGVVGVLANGPGPTALVRADMDALPVREETGLRYASRQRATDRDGYDVPVMHACGHGVVGVLATAPGRPHWSAPTWTRCPSEKKRAFPMPALRATDRDGYDVPVMHACGQTCT